MIEVLVAKLRARDQLREEEIAALAAAMSDRQGFGPRQVVIAPGTELTRSTLILSGFAIRYKDLPDGRRQISEFHMPGDFVDLHGFLLKKLEHGVMTLGDCELAFFPHERLREISERHPHLTRLLWLSTLIDASIHGEWLLSVGRRSALERIAHLLCEVEARLAVIGALAGDSFDLPLTQIDLADMIGLTAVHVNRTLRQLRERGIAELRRGRVTILDRARLQAEAGFDPTYLMIEQRPR